jgi:integrase
MAFYFEITTLAEKSWEEGKRIFEKDIKPEIGSLKAVDIKRYDVKQLHQKICDRGAPTMANRVLELMRRGFNVAFEEEFIPINTYPNIRKIKTKERPRDRILNDYEIKSIWEALDTETDNARDILRLLLLLGQRSMETMSMCLADIDIEKRQWTVPPDKTKNHKPNVLIIPDLAWSIIKPRLKNKKWIFPTAYNRTRKGAKNMGHTRSTKDVRRRLREKTKITGWTAHDLRRTARTLMAREGVPPNIAEQVVGHVQPGIEAIYDQYHYLEEKGEALKKVEAVIKRIVGIKADEEA